MRALSGGWKMRVAPTRVLLGMPDVLLTDEPTNHPQADLLHVPRKGGQHREYARRANAGGLSQWKTSLIELFHRPGGYRNDLEWNYRG
jgi:hypothetical protein